MKARYSVLALALLGVLSHAQQRPAPSAPVPPNLAPSKAEAPPLSAQDRLELQKIPLGNAVQALQADEPRIVVDRRQRPRHNQPHRAPRPGLTILATTIFRSSSHCSQKCCVRHSQEPRPVGEQG